jgi:putative transposase
VKRAYKLRAYPTRPQEGRAVRMLADHCDLYNAALAERRQAWRMSNRSITYGDQSAQLKERKVGYPRFKSHQRFDQVLFVAGDGARWEPADGGRWAHTSFQAVGRVKVRQHRPVMGQVKTLRLKREHRRWYVIVVTETQPVPLPSIGRAVGIDLGVARFLTTSDGEIVANPRFLDAAQTTIAALQRRKQHARPGSGNRTRLRRALARECRKIRTRRRDFHHKTARALVNTCDAVALEALRMNGMTASARGTVEQPGTNVAAKSGLSRSILDAGWAQLMIILTAKAESAGRRVVRVAPSYTSVTCHICGARCRRPRQDTVVCPTHGELDADLNGARNIAARAGLGSGQASAA